MEKRERSARLANQRSPVTISTLAPEFSSKGLASARSDSLPLRVAETVGARYWASVLRYARYTCRSLDARGRNVVGPDYQLPSDRVAEAYLVTGVPVPGLCFRRSCYSSQLCSQRSWQPDYLLGMVVLPDRILTLHIMCEGPGMHKDGSETEAAEPVSRVHIWHGHVDHRPFSDIDQFSLFRDRDRA